MTAAPTPRLSIGVPVHNGAATLEAALRSLVEQTLDGIEIIISDNASTDGTAAICAAFAAREPRIAVHRQERLVDAYDNFAFVLARAKAPFFMWAAHDDTRDRDFAARLVAALEAEPGAILAFGDVAEITAAGLQPLPFVFDTRGLAPFRKFLLTARQLEGFQYYGVWRTAMLRRIPLIELQFGPDKAILMAAAALGDFIHVPGTRHHWHRSSRRALGWPRRGPLYDLYRYADLAWAVWLNLWTTGRSTSRVAGRWRGVQAFAAATTQILAVAGRRMRGGGRI